VNEQSNSYVVLVLVCSSVESLTKDCLGFAGEVYEHVLVSGSILCIESIEMFMFIQGEEKFTFIEGCRNPRSVTVLLKGSTKYVLNQLKDALRDGLRSVNNAIEDGSFWPVRGNNGQEYHYVIVFFV
jgi:T-complex protein 1 subunit zeta